MTISKDRICSIIFLFSIPLMQIRAFWTRVSFLDAYIGYFDYIVLMILVFSAMLNLVSKKISLLRFFVIIGLSIIAVMSFVCTGSSNLAYIILYPLAASTTNISKILKVDLLAKVFTLAAMPILQGLGLTHEKTFYREDIARQSFGFPHPNTLGYICIIICLEFLYLMKNKNGIRVMLLRILIPVILLYFCKIADSRTAMIAVIASASYAVFEATLSAYKTTKNRSSSFVKNRIILMLLPIVMVTACFVTTAAYDAGKMWAKKVDNALSTRVSLQSYYNRKYGSSLLGSKEANIESWIIPIDNGFYHIYIVNGCIGLIALLLIIELSMYVASKSNKSIVMILIVLLFYSLSEWTVFRIVMTPFWTIAFAKEEQDEKKKITK